MVNDIQTTYYPMERVFRNPIITIPLKSLPVIIRQIGKNAKTAGNNIAIDISNRHLQISKSIIENSDKRDNAKNALISHLKYKQGSKFKNYVISESLVTGFFEYGVKQHEVYRDMVSVAGYSVGKWMDDHGLSDFHSFTVGKPGTSLAKTRALHFMERGYEESFNESDKIADKWIKNI